MKIDRLFRFGICWKSQAKFSAEKESSHKAKTLFHPWGKNTVFESTHYNITIPTLTKILLNFHLTLMAFPVPCLYASVFDQE